MVQFQYLARKIRCANWDRPIYIPKRDLRSVAVTSCLRTSGKDDLSFWQCNESLMSVSEVALAIGSTSQKIDKSEVVLVSFNDLNEIECRYTFTDGQSNIRDFNSRHVDLIELSLSRLRRLGWKIKNNIKKKNHYFSFSKKDVENLFIKAYVEKKIVFSQIEESLQLELGKLLKNKGISLSDDDKLIVEMNEKIKESRANRKILLNKVLAMSP